MKKPAIIIAAVMLLSSASAVASAAPLSPASFVIEAPSSAAAGQELAVRVYMDTGDQGSVNAVSAGLRFSPSELSFDGASDGGSVVSLWMEKPHASAVGTLSLSGIIPGGFSGSRGSVTTLYFKALKQGPAVLATFGSSMLLNDGLGTPASTTETEASIVVSRTTASSQAASSVQASSSGDSTPPEPFTPVVSEDPSVFGGDYFVSFSTTDKGSGVDRYEVSEAGQPPVVAESPYELTAQKEGETVTVTAVDKAGNARTETAVWSGASKAGDRWPVWLALVVVLLLAIWGAYAYHSRQRARY